MSWQKYVDSNICGYGDVTSAAILDINTGAVWAASKGLSLDAGKCAAIAKAIKNGDSSICGTGAFFSGDKFRIIKIQLHHEDNTYFYMIGKSGSNKFFYAKGTKLCVICGLLDKSITKKYMDGEDEKIVGDSNVLKRVDEIAAYLIASNY